jgi:predicted Zn-dependent protease
VRIVALAIALAVAAWFAIGVHQARDVAQATSILAGGGPLRGAQARHASAALHSAAFLNPDRQVDVLRARVYLARGNEAAARTLLGRVVAAEPDYLDAWIWLARSSVGDLKDFYAAAYRIRQLVAPGRASH